MNIRAVVQEYGDGFYAIRYGKEYIRGALGEPLVHRSREVMEYLAAHINTKKQSERGFALDEPYATLYYTLSWLPVIENRADPISLDPHWVISCDPVFHLEPGPPMIQVQMAAYEPVKAWLEELGTDYVDLPLLYLFSEKDLEEARKEPGNYIGEENSSLILDEWNALTDAGKALACFIQYNTLPHSRNSLCGAILLLQGRITGQEWAEISCAAGNISPLLGDVSKKDFNNHMKYYQAVAGSIPEVLRLLNPS